MGTGGSFPPPVILRGLGNASVGPGAKEREGGRVVGRGVELQ